MNDELSDFTKLVLARMESNPEEFQANSRWDNLVRGLEEYARGYMDGRYVKTLWPLEHQEIEVLMTKYRKMYLDRLHKEMLKNIVSGNDLGPSVEQTYPAKLGKKSNTVLTTAQIQNQSLALLNKSFDDAYDANRNVYTAIAKQEGAQIDPNADYKYVAKEQRAATKLKKILITPADVRIAGKLGMTVEDYIERRDAA